MDGVHFEFDAGFQKLLDKLKERPAVMRRIAGKVLFQEAEELMSASKPLVPVDHGFLVNSGHVALPVFQGDSASVTCGYGGVAGSGNLDQTSNLQDVGYAVYVHEDLTKHHPHGQAKYLEAPLNERKDSMSERFADRIASELNQGS